MFSALMKAKLQHSDPLRRLGTAEFAKGRHIRFQIDLLKPSDFPEGVL
jgi:hypothetical protein